MGLRINNNISAINAHNQILKTDSAMSKSLQKLSSGFRINSAADKPAGLVISEQLRAQISGMNQAIENSQRASNIVGTAEGALNEMNTLLKSMRGLAVEAANTGGLDSGQIAANQDEIDSAISTIDRIANSTKFAGKRLLNGTQSYLETGAATAGITEFTVRGAQFGAASTIDVIVNVTAQSSRATNGSALAGTATADSVVRISGAGGSEIFSFASGMSIANVVAAVNALSSNTGVYASTNGQFFSREFGDAAFITIESLEGTFEATDVNHTRGTDLTATVNGMSGSTSGNFLNVSSTFFTGQVELSAGAALLGGATAGSYTFSLQESGMKFQLGSDTNPNEQKSIGIQNMHSTNLGRSILQNGSTESGFLSSLKSGASHALATDADSSVKIIDFAIADVNRIRSELGAFQKNTLDSNINNLRVTTENLTAAESRIRDVDFAAEMMEFTKQQILTQSGTSMMSQANLSSQSVLGLLG